MGETFNPQNITHPFGVSDASAACKTLEQRFTAEIEGKQKWPSMLHENLNPLNEIIKDGKIDPSEFDSNLENLSERERNHLMKEVRKHPLIRSVE